MDDIFALNVPLAPSYGIYISQLVRYARVCSDVSDFNERNRFITEKLLQQGYRYHKLLKTFTKFFHRYKEIIQKFGCSRRSLIKNGISHPKFYGNIVYKAQNLSIALHNSQIHLISSFKRATTTISSFAH